MRAIEANQALSKKKTSSKINNTSKSKGKPKEKTLKSK